MSSTRLLLGLALAGCTTTEPALPKQGQAPATPHADDTGTRAATAKAPSTATPPGPPSGGVDELPELHGQSESQLVLRFGAPSTRREFSMAECCTEFDIELFNTYRPERKDLASIRIIALEWDFDGYAVTAWLHRVGDAWQVLDTSRYSDGVEF